VGYGCGDSKAIGEEFVGRSSLPYVIARPTLTVGERDSVVFCGIAHSLGEGKLRLVGDLNVVQSLIGDVAEAMVDG